MTAPVPGVIAADGEPRCGRHGTNGLLCTRPQGHAGGHVDSDGDGAYWPAVKDIRQQPEEKS